MKFSIKVELLNNGRHRWQVLESSTGNQVVSGEHEFPGQARHDAMMARRALSDNPQLEQAIYDLQNMEQNIASDICDEQEKAEENCISEGVHFDDFSEGECQCGEVPGPKRTQCQNCLQEWCERCDPLPGAMCHWCHGNEGNGYATGAPEFPLKQGIVYMENAAPELDEARTHVQEAYVLIEQYLSQQEENQDGKH